jgi:hypothetical protein
MLAGLCLFNINFVTWFVVVLCECSISICFDLEIRGSNYAYFCVWRNCIVSLNSFYHVKVDVV